MEKEKKRNQIQKLSSDCREKLYLNILVSFDDATICNIGDLVLN